MMGSKPPTFVTWTCIIFLFVQIFNVTKAETILIKERFSDVTMVVGEEEQVFVDVNRQIIKSITSNGANETLNLYVDITLDAPETVEVISLYQPIRLALGSSFPIWMRAKTVGVVSMKVNVYSKDPTIIVRTSNGEQLHYTLFVGRFQGVQYLTSLLGWIYVLFWNLSFYPQVIHNFRRHSVLGMHFDYLAFNMVGHTCYMVYNVGLYSVTSVKEEYQRRHPFGANPIAINDIFFPVHAVILCLIAIVQCFCYERGTQKISTTCRILVGCFLLLILDRLYLAIFGTVSWLDWLYFLSMVKIGITLLKYIPQAHFNYQRQSTRGWTIGTVLLDLLGGTFSLAQMFINAWNHDDWTSLYGNIAKLGLGGFSIFFDMIFVIQHFLLYRNNNRAEIMVKYEEEECSLLEQISSEESTIQ